MEKSSYDLKMTKSTLFVKIDLGSQEKNFDIDQKLRNLWRERSETNITSKNLENAS